VIYFEYIFTQKLLVYFTNNQKERNQEKYTQHEYVSGISHLHSVIRFQKLSTCN